LNKGLKIGHIGSVKIYVVESPGYDDDPEDRPGNKKGKKYALPGESGQDRTKVTNFALENAHQFQSQPLNVYLPIVSQGSPKRSVSRP
jgi:hypothetical protein